MPWLRTAALGDESGRRDSFGQLLILIRQGLGHGVGQLLLIGGLLRLIYLHLRWCQRHLLHKVQVLVPAPATACLRCDTQARWPGVMLSEWWSRGRLLQYMLVSEPVLKIIRYVEAGTVCEEGLPRNGHWSRCSRGSETAVLPAPIAGIKKAAKDLSKLLAGAEKYLEKQDRG